MWFFPSFEGEPGKPSGSFALTPDGRERLQSAQVSPAVFLPVPTALRSAVVDRSRLPLTKAILALDGGGLVGGVSSGESVGWVVKAWGFKRADFVVGGCVSFRLEKDGARVAGSLLERC